MSRPVLRISNLGKAYQLGELGVKTLLNRRSQEDFWALKDVSLEVKQGEVLGIIGANGAGKSTLLKLLAQITTPTAGSIKAKGRIASLLEVGTGMHPDLTGRENIYLNGAILGMSKSEIDQKFDEIVAFSGCEDFVETPLKRYSSGMKVRLGFSVAVHLEPEIIIVDEVLAVGDAEFQVKAIAKITELTSNADRTVLFVSHSMAAIRSLCSRCILLREGQVAFEGDVETAIAKYIGYESLEKTMSREWTADFPGNEKVQMRAALVIQNNEVQNNWLDAENSFDLQFEVDSLNGEPLDCTVQICSVQGDVIAVTSTLQEGVTSKGKKAQKRYQLQIPSQLFNEREYRVNVMFVANKQYVVWRYDDVFRLGFVGGKRESNQWMGQSKGHLLPHWTWTVD